MLTKRIKFKIFFLLIFFIFSVAIIFFTLKSLEENVVYFFSPTEIYNKSDISYHEKIRIGGLVKEGSINKDNEAINFIITDLKNEIFVYYKGMIPNLFSEGKGVVAEGQLRDRKYFIAKTILAKHDENYMPPELNKVIND